jgi:Polyketide cyclase / dehydrase and lipid transport
MFEFTESVRVEAGPQQVWDVLRDIDNWWLASNDEHVDLEHLDDRPATEVGAKLRIHEKIGGIPGEAVGLITAVEPGSAVTWEADATYRWLGLLSVPVKEGVTWRVQPHGDDATEISARVWARFPHKGIGRLAAFAFTRLLNGVAKDRQHARTELEYLKGIIEGW